MLVSANRGTFIRADCVLARQTVGSSKAADALAERSLLALQSLRVAFACCELR